MKGFTPDTLDPYIAKFIRQQRVRGIWCDGTARSATYSFASLSRSFGDRALNRFNESSLDQWFADTPGISPGTRRVRVTYCKGLSRWLYDAGLIKRDVLRDYPTPSLPRRIPVTLPHDDVALMLGRFHGDPRIQSIIWLMVGLGLRCVEVSRLDVDHYDPKELTLRVIGKAGHERILPVSEEVAAALDAYLDQVGRVRGPLIRSERLDYKPGRLEPQTISKYVSSLMKECGIKGRSYDGRSAHGLRRTAATDVMDQVHDITVVQAMLGHARPETTALYVKPPSFDRLRASIGGRTYRPSPPAAGAVA